jgi:hypothetical protein
MKRYRVHVSETVHSWRVIEVIASNEEEAKMLAEDEYDGDWAEHATSEIETTILTENGKEK